MIHLSYLYNNRKEYKLNGFALGVTYNPSFHPQLRVIAEYDSKDFALGALICCSSICMCRWKCRG